MSRIPLLTSPPTLLRQDNRRPLELRHFSFSLSPSGPVPSGPNPASSPPSNSSGHATLTHGLTQVRVYVYGPRDGSGTSTSSFSGLINPGAGGGGGGSGRGDKCVLEVGLGVGVGSEGGGGNGVRRKGDRRSQDICTSIKNTFEPVVMTSLYPRSEIDIWIEVIQQDGALLQAAINCTTLALISAGIPLSDYIAACCVGALSPQFTLPTAKLASSTEDEAMADTNNSSQTGLIPLLDLTAVEESSLPVLTVAILPSSTQDSESKEKTEPKLTLLNLENDRLPIEEFERLMQVAIMGCEALAKEMKSGVRNWVLGLAGNAAVETGQDDSEETKRPEFGHVVQDFDME